MAKLSRAQSIVAATLVLLGLIYLAVLIGGPVLEYLHGPSPETVLLKRLADAGLLALLFVGIAALIMQRIGVLPTIRVQGFSNYQPTPAKSLRNLAIWIVIALVLVFLFNFFQQAGKPPGQAPVTRSDGSLAGQLVNLFPILILVGVWIFFLRQMQRRKSDHPPDNP